MEEISNPDLIERKKTLLQNLSFDFSQPSSDLVFNCNYHNIPLRFITQSSSFITSLEKLIPAHWKRENDDFFSIALFDPRSLGFTSEEWADESSQDCLSYDENKIAIQRDFAAKIESDKVVLICEGDTSDGFYNFLRWFISGKLIAQGKFVMHSSCVLSASSKNQAYLFLGHSGAGKTTITELSSPRLVLGDDMNILSEDKNVLTVEAGAIGGRFNSMIGYDHLVPIKGIYWLVQDDHDELVPLDRMKGAQKLLASFANLHWPTMKEKDIQKLLDFAESASSRVPFYELHFKKSISIWDLLEK